MFPDTVYFKLIGEDFARIDIEYSEEKTKFTYENSCVVVNNATVKTNPFDLAECRVNPIEVKDLISQLPPSPLVFLPKIFFDCAAALEGATIVYSDENYFSSKLYALSDHYIDIHSDIEQIKSKLQEYQGQILELQNERELSCMKIFIEGSESEHIKHVILLTRYQDRWFTIDSGKRKEKCRDCSVAQEEVIESEEEEYLQYDNFSRALYELGIKSCDNNSFGQSGPSCDTCASVNSFLLISYLKKNKKLDLTPDDDIDFEKILQFAMSEQIFPIPTFFL